MYELAFIIFGTCTITSFLIFDSILRVQHFRYHELWEADGKPHGFFFYPKNSSWMAMQVRFLVLYFSTPTWIRQEPKLVRQITIFSVAQVVGIATWLMAAYFMFVVGRK